MAEAEPGQHREQAGDPVQRFGGGGRAELDAWIGHSLPAGLIAHLQHFALRGRQNPNELTWFDRSMLFIGGLMNRDRVAGRQEMHGFDFMDRSSIEPIVERIRRLQESKVAASKGP